jgi:putative phosphoribosyl transferase
MNELPQAMPRTPLRKRLLIRSPAVRAELIRPGDAVALVLLVDGAGSGHPGTHAGAVTDVLQSHHLATLRFDDGAAASQPAHRRAGGAGELAERVDRMVAWAIARDELVGLNLGILGGPAGAKAAFSVAVQRPGDVGALVVYGADSQWGVESLARVQAPTLLIVGGRDLEAVKANQASLARLADRRRLEVVPEATRHFEEPGALVTMAHLAGAWFETHLAMARRQ